MRVRFVTVALALFAACTMASGAFASPAFEQNANASMTKPKPRRKTVSKPAAPAASGDTATMQGESKPKPRRMKKKAAPQGVPTGAQNCIDALITMAATDPLPDYEGRPADIINNGLLWTDAKSKCSIGTDAALRLKVFSLAAAWRAKDASRVRTLLPDIKSSAPQN